MSADGIRVGGQGKDEVTFKPRIWRWDDALKAVVIAVLLELLILTQYGHGGVTSTTALVMGIGLVVVALCFLPDLKTLSIGSGQVSLSKRGLLIPRRRSSSVPVSAISSLRLRINGCALCDDAGRSRLPIGTGWTRQQYLAVAELLAVPLYDHRVAFGLFQRKSGRLLFDPGQSGSPGPA